MLATAIFDHVFIKSNISAMDRLFVVKFLTNIANRWLFMIQIKIMVIYTSLFIVKHDSKKGKSETIRLQGYNAHIR